MKPGSSMPHSQELSTIPILCRINPIPRTDTYFLRSILILSSYLCLRRPEGLFPIGVTVKALKTLRPSILATWPAHLNLLDLIFLTILGERPPRWSSG